jgi:hypothetical protein
MKKLFGIILLAGLIVFPILSMAQINVPVPLPPPIPFVGPPNVVILPGMDVYAVPDVKEELFFRQGWWWRYHGGNWYRSKYHDQGWAHYRGYPSWHKRIPNDWRGNYINSRWGGRPWNHSYIRHGDLDRHWRGRPGGGPGGSHLPGGKPGGPAGHNLHGGGSGGHNLHGGGPGGPRGRNLQDGGPGGSGGRNLHGGGPGGRTHPDGRMNRGDAGGSHRGDRR